MKTNATRQNIHENTKFLKEKSISPYEPQKIVDEIQFGFSEARSSFWVKEWNLIESKFRKIYRRT